MPKTPSPLEFPCVFPIKIVGYNSPELIADVLTILKQQFPEITATQLVQRLSRDNKYLAITVTVTALKQQQLDLIYQSLTINEKVIMAL